VSISAEHVDALNAVDLQLSFGSHGIVTALEGHGTAVLMVNDGDFGRANDFVSGLDPNNGDRLAYEGVGFDRPWDRSGFMDGLAWEVRGSRHLTQRDISSLESNSLASLSDRLEALEKLRRYQITGPIEYAVYKSLLRDVPIHYADASQDQLNAWWDEREEAVKKLPRFLDPLLSEYFEYRSYGFRDLCTISCLGEIAIEMEGAQGERPKLGYMGGEGHRKNIETVLTEAGIDFTSSSFSPNRKALNRSKTLRSMENLVLRFVDSPEDYYSERWMANAAAQS
jgi:hypothetical protein